jgi:ATP-dependent Clp protease ATP-binding subunit ClpA
MANSIIDSAKLRMLLQIQQAKLTVEERSLKQAQHEYTEAFNQKKEREEKVSSIKNKVIKLQKYISLDKNYCSPDNVNRANIYRFWLNYDLEMHEYYLSQEEKKLEKAKSQYESARRSWMKQKIKTDNLSDMHKQQKNTELSTKEEIEDEYDLEDRIDTGRVAYGKN